MKYRTVRFEAEGPEAVRRPLEALTPREHQVLELIAAGHTNKMIAAKLHLSPRTVEFHRAHIMHKTGAKGLAGLIRLWHTARRS